MERAVFQLESDGTRIPCLLNPENLLVERTAGVRARGLTTGPLSGGAGAHDPLLYTGGGRTEVTLRLVFDTSLVTSLAAPAPTDPEAGDDAAPPAPAVEDVRDLTRPLMALGDAQASDDADTPPAAPLVRFFWGKAWNLLGVVTAAAERLEYFNEAGSPRRSWLSMRMVLLPDPETASKTDAATDASRLDDTADPTPLSLDPDAVFSPDELEVHSVLSDGDPDDPDRPAERPEQIAADRLGDPSLWRLICQYNDIDDPLQSLAGMVLRIPPKSAAVDSV